ncbi:RimK/LysX family protein, partial [Tritonibacter sp. SIMBA_163]
VRDEWIEAPIERRVKIVQASGEESRPVISLLMTLGPIRENVEFTLNDRTHLDYPVLLGRRFMLDIATIDVAETYLHE